MRFDIRVYACSKVTAKKNFCEITNFFHRRAVAFQCLMIMITVLLERIIICCLVGFQFFYA